MFRNKLNLFNKKELLWLLIIFILFLSLRVIGWSNADELDDHDSVGYLSTAESIENWNFENIDTSDTFFYPSFIVVFDFLELEPITAARSVSFFFSIILFFTIFLIGKKITSPKGNLLGLILISFSPVLISLSFAILSEPSYLGTVYLGMFLLFYSIENQNLIRAFFIGLIFGLAFSNRAEGIIFLLLIPLLKLILWLKNKKNFFITGELKWIGIFLLGYLLIAAPIIIKVSSQMGEFSINGRSSWEKLLKVSDGSYDEKINSLDFSPAEVNLSFILHNPDALNKAKESISFFSRLKIMINNVTDLYTHKLSGLVGSFILILFGIGAYFLFKRKLSDFIICSSFILITLMVPCMFLESFDIRHIAIAAPMIILISGTGVSEFSLLIENFLKGKVTGFIRQKVSYLLITVIIIFQLGWLNNSLRHPTINDEYDLNNYLKPISILKTDLSKNEVIDPKIISRKSYFTYFADMNAVRVRMPYTEYGGLVNYARLNNADYLFLEYDLLKGYPFLEKFDSGECSDFSLLFSGKDKSGKKIELYKLKLSDKIESNQSPSD